MSHAKLQMHRRSLRRLGFIVAVLSAPLLSVPESAHAAGGGSCTKPLCIEFQAPEAFLSEAFGGQVPAPQVLNLDDAAQAKISAVFNRSFPQARVRYWQQGDRTAWIFDDIGKKGYVPTTAGFVVRAGGQLDYARVLQYRESRGEQVGEPSFLTQLSGARDTGSGLDVQVDNISGATLSVQMMQRMVRTALVLDSLVR
ncbi:MAG: FMN-binding protein [Nevskiales bacterium]|nr:FMN-binding protein [Nevskiales bacterium]